MEENKTLVADVYKVVQIWIFHLKTHRDMFDDEEEEDKPEMSLISALLCFGVDYDLDLNIERCLVDSIDGLCTSMGLSWTFTGLIILPVVGRAVEHI